MKLLEWFNRTRSLERIGYAFTDIVEGKPVYYYKDYNGEIWIKNSKWSLFEVKRNATYQNT